MMRKKLSERRIGQGREGDGGVGSVDGTVGSGVAVG